MNLEKLGAGEWLEPDGLGGFASGSADGLRTRRYHALLLAATAPPTGRLVLVNGLDARLETAQGTQALSSQRYAPGVVDGDGAHHIEAFGWEPWPHWIFRLDDGTRVEMELFVPKGRPMTCLSWRLLGPRRPAKLFVRPFLSGRDYHALHQANPNFRFEAETGPGRVSWQPYPDVPGVTALTNGRYEQDPRWYYQFLYQDELNRGLDAREDLAAPGVFTWDLADGPAGLILTPTPEAAIAEHAEDPLVVLDQARRQESRRRAGFASRLDRAADAYIVSRRPRGMTADSKPAAAKTILAGYPWFTDWGRDAFIALRGLCLATGRLDDARAILLAWAGAVSEGMLPNRFPDQGEQPEFNSVDASLWFIVAVHEYLRFRNLQDDPTAPPRPISRSVAADVSRLNPTGPTPGRIHSSTSEDQRLLAAVEAILEGYSRGTRFGIRADTDGLLACGVPGVQLTWMDAKVGDWVVTPRLGKPVEIQALWLNALWIAGQHNSRWNAPFRRGLDAFHDRFWNPERQILHDVVDVDHRAGVNDPAFRPNQILAVGGLPFRLIDDNRAFLIVEAVKDRLWTPLGLRSLAPGEPGYTPHYTGGVRERDGAYHQGTVWPWLLGAYVDAWTWVHRRTPAALREARRQYLQPLLDHLETAGLGHISEIADANAPHTPRGCPWQAWSVGEALWLDRVVLATPNLPPPTQSAPTPPHARVRARRLLPAPAGR